MREKGERVQTDRRMRDERAEVESWERRKGGSRSQLRLELCSKIY